MALEDDIASFERVPMLAALGAQALRILAIGAETRRLQNGAVLFYAGEVADGAYLVQDGSLLLEPGTSDDGKKEIVGPGALVNELALLTDQVASKATAIAKEPTVVVRISRSLFLKTLEGYPPAARALRDMMGNQIEDWMRDISKVRSKLKKHLPSQ
jgi:CRP-like cAMP-binding protein